ncbi:hypothetical protein [Bartonella sp. AP88HLJMH]|uniref:hypothetical protein n=1 Tax=Bartonella sp. AP88HLJMH TaxID=3243505 RepID=UPI0035CF4024
MFNALPQIAKPLDNRGKSLFELLPMGREIKSSSNDVFSFGDGGGIGTKINQDVCASHGKAQHT